MDHSRLLKFVVPCNIPKMAENNNEVQSEVPGSQKLRDADENADSSSKPKIISSFIEVHTEVGDGEKVVRRHQVIRNGDTEKESSTEEKPTKIPISRLRQTVEKVKAKRQNSKEKSKQSQIPRRSSLPKTTAEPKSAEEITAEPRSTEPKSLPAIPLDDEFDKLFQEVVKDNTVVASLESKFEEIRHDYDENKIQPIDVDKIKKSKIPFLKRQSLQDGDSVQIRTNKLIAARDKIRLRKSISNNDEKYEKISKDIVESIKNESESTKTENERTKTEENQTVEINITKLETKYDISSNKTKTSEVKLVKSISQESEKSDFDIQKNVTHISTTDNEIDTFKAVELLKQAFENKVDTSPNKITEITKSFSQENVNSTIASETKIIKSYERENSLKIEINEDSYKIESSESTETVQNTETFESTETVTNNEISQKYEAKFYKTFSIESENDLTSHKIVTSIYENQNNFNNNKLSDVNCFTNIEEKINKTESIENNKSYAKNISAEENKFKYPAQVEIPKEKSAIHNPVTKTLEMHGFVIKKSDINEFVAKKISIHESIGSNIALNAFEKAISRDLKVDDIVTIDDQNKNLNNNSDISSTNFKKVSTDFDKTQSDLRPNESEIPNTEVPSVKEVARDVLKEKDRDALYATTFKGKVGRMISKIDSKENIELETKDSIEGMPKKKSILSKIAMFERHEPESNKPKNARPKLSKLITNDIQTKEEERVHVHTPMIVHEVFKPFQGNRTLISESIKNEPPITEIEEHSLIETNELEAFPQENVNKLKVFKYEIPETNTPISDAPVIVSKLRPVKEILSKFENKENEILKTKPFSYSLSKNEAKPEDNTVEITKTFDQSISKNEFKKEENTGGGIKTVDYRSLSKTEVTQVKESKVFNNKIENETKTGENNVDIPFGDITADESVIIKQKTEVTKLNTEKDPEIIKNQPKVNNNKVLNKIPKSEVILPNGNVKTILHRIKSFDKIELNKKEVSINIKELPRQRSVSEKIALFEGKLTAIRGQHVETSTLTTTTVPTTTATSEDLQEKINELTTKYGSVEVPGVQLSNGVTMPVLAVGTANLNSKLIKHIIGAAIDMGYRAIDSAYIYGNEKEVGEAIRAKIEDGTVKREDLFIINKLWSTFHKEDLVRGACEASLKTMGLDYFDLYLVHNPMSFKEGPSPIPKIATVIQYSQNTFIDAWHGMSSLYKAKLVRAIGVSNFNSKQVQLVLDKGTVRPVVNQVECHPYLSQERLRKFCKERNITLSCFGVLGSKGTPAQYRGIVEAVIDDPLVKVLASGLGITPSQLLISYQLKNNHTVVVKSSTAAHLWDNIQAVNVELSTAEVEGLSMLNKNKRMFNFKGMGDTHKNYPFNIPF